MTSLDVADGAGRDSKALGNQTMLHSFKRSYFNNLFARQMALESRQPALTAQNPGNVVYPDVETESEFSLGNRSSNAPYFVNIRPGEFGRPHLAIATLVSHVAHIFEMRAKPQVVWINTGSIVPSGAIMQNPLSVRNWSEVDHPASAMCLDVAKGISSGKSAISEAVFASNPNPTGACCINIVPKSFHRVGGKTLRQKIWKISFVVHTWFKLRVCRVLGYLRIARTSSFKQFTIKLQAECLRNHLKQYEA